MHKKVMVLKQIRKSLELGSGVYAACKAVGIGYATLWRWRDKSERIKRYLDVILDGRNILVEDALYKEALKGNTVALIFWLTNRASDRWADRRAIFKNIINNRAGDNGKLTDTDKAKSDKLLGRLDKYFGSRKS